METISIVIPTFNRSGYIDECIKSALMQDYPNLQVIVIDNASTDDTADRVQKYVSDKRLTYVCNDKNVGMVGNWKKALDFYVKGEYFLILSDDDYLLDSNYISKAVELIRENTNVLMVYANGYIKNEQTGDIEALNIPVSEFNRGKDIFKLRGKVLPIDFSLCNVLFHTETAKKLNCFANKDNLCCDSELFLKMALLGNVAFVQNPVSVYRIHGDNLVLKILQDYTLFTNHWMYYTAPFVYAVENQLLTKAEIESVFADFTLPSVSRLLLYGKVYHPDFFEQIIYKIHDDLGSVYFKKIERTAFVRILKITPSSVVSFVFNVYRSLKALRKTG